MREIHEEEIERAVNVPRYRAYVIAAPHGKYDVVVHPDKLTQAEAQAITDAINEAEEAPHAGR